MRAEESVEINRPLQEVFSYVANPKNIPEWSNLALEVRERQKANPTKATGSSPPPSSWAVGSRCPSR